MAVHDDANSRYAVSLLAMPFLAHPDPSDYNAVLALYLTSQKEPSQLATIMRHPTLVKGITDPWTPVVATLYSAARQNSALIPELLDPGRVSIERAATQTSSGASIQLAIVRVGTSRAPQTLDLLRAAVQNVQRDMARDFLNRSVTLLSPIPPAWDGPAPTTAAMPPSTRRTTSHMKPPTTTGAATPSGSTKACQNSWPPSRNRPGPEPGSNPTPCPVPTPEPSLNWKIWATRWVPNITAATIRWASDCS